MKKISLLKILVLLSAGIFIIYLIFYFSGYDTKYVCAVVYYILSVTFFHKYIITNNSHYKRNKHIKYYIYSILLIVYPITTLIIYMEVIGLISVVKLIFLNKITNIFEIISMVIFLISFIVFIFLNIKTKKGVIELLHSFIHFLMNYQFKRVRKSDTQAPPHNKNDRKFYNIKISEYNEIIDINKFTYIDYYKKVSQKKTLKEKLDYSYNILSSIYTYNYKYINDSDTMREISKKIKTIDNEIVDITTILELIKYSDTNPDEALMAENLEIISTIIKKYFSLLKNTPNKNGVKRKEL